MESLFEFISNGFASGYPSGFSCLAVSLCGIGFVCYVLYWLGVLLWGFVEDKKVIELVPSFFITHNEEKMSRVYYRDETPDKYIRLTDRWGVKAWFLKSKVVYKLSFQNIVSIPVLGAILGIIIAWGVGLGITLVLAFPVFFSVLFSFIGFILLLRGVRRLQKKLAQHVSDIDAHKQKKE